MAPFFRRSRSGCLTCRELHRKCDEQRPQCRLCLNKGLECKGYARQLRWADDKKKTVDSVEQQTCVVKQSPNSADYSLYNLDAMLIGHWMMVSIQLGCLDPASSEKLGSMYLDLIRQPGSIALHAILAGSAAHMLSLRMIPEHVFVRAKQRSLATMINTVKGFNSSSTKQPSIIPSRHHLPSTAISDASILASLLLLGPAIIYGGSDHNLGHVRWLLQGARSLIAERYRYFECHCGLNHAARSLPQIRLDSPLFMSTVRTLAYTDILACVPCAKKPLLSKIYWLEDAVHSMHTGARALRPDMDLGYSASILALLGDCAAVVDELYSTSITKAAFSLQQATLIRQLEVAMRNLPPLVDEEDIKSTQGFFDEHMIVAHNHSIRAALAHAIAAQIFLLRSTDPEQDSSEIMALRNRLFQILASLPMNHPAATTILWPIWVLGCECSSDDENPLRQQVRTMLEDLYNASRMDNIRICLRKLQQDIWLQKFEYLSAMSEQPQPFRQSSWVRRCWDQKIELLLA